MASIKDRLTPGYVYRQGNGERGSEYNAFHGLMGDIKAHELSQYPSITTSLSGVFANSPAGFSVKCFTLLSKDYTEGIYKGLLPACQFSVTGRFPEKTKAVACIKKCVLSHTCQEPSYMLLRGDINKKNNINIGNGEQRRRNSKRSFIESQSNVLLSIQKNGFAEISKKKAGKQVNPRRRILLLVT